MKLNGVIELRLGEDVFVFNSGELKRMENNEKNQLVYIFERATLIFEHNKGKQQ